MFKLVKILPNGQRLDIASDISADDLIVEGKKLQRQRPSEQFGVTDGSGFFVWPPRLATACIEPEAYRPIIKMDYV